jgi:hypothetical protein
LLLVINLNTGAIIFGAEKMETLKMETLTKSKCKDPSQIMKDLQELDLDCIKIKLMLMQKKETGRHWTMDKINKVCGMYKNFLYLAATEEDSVVPTSDIDEFWHVHILDTQKYYADCERIFGNFIHHFPYFGIRSDGDGEELEEAFKKTCGLYKDAFGEKYTQSSGNESPCSHCKDVRCRTCKGGSSFIEEGRPSLDDPVLMKTLGLTTYLII